jgi:hypothetical protein
VVVVIQLRLWRVFIAHMIFLLLDQLYKRKETTAKQNRALTPDEIISEEYGVVLRNICSDMLICINN